MKVQREDFIKLYLAGAADSFCIDCILYCPVSFILECNVLHIGVYAILEQNFQY